MQAAAAAERYEEAAHWRDAVRTVEALRDRQQKMATTGLGDRDGFGVRLGPRGSAVVVFQMRGGRVVDRIELWSEGVPVAGGVDGLRSSPASREGEVVAAALSQFYAVHVPPPQVHVPEPLEDAAAIEDWLSSRAGRRVRIVVPRRGDKRSLLELATRNARVAYESRSRETPAGAGDALEALRLALQLTATPRRIDCFDISTFQGSETVASMVVCEDGRMQPREYRKFRIRPGEDAPLPEGVTAQARVEAPPGNPAAAARILDDFKSMRQVVRRRYRAVVEGGGPMPDLIVIDGGKGQLAAAYAALTEVGLDRTVAIGLAKQEELVFTRDSADAIAFPPGSPALRLLQRIRDEAHRFAVTYHRQARTRRDLRSALDVIAGVGPRRRNTLLKRFGSVAGVRRATREELTAVVGAKAADAILAHFAHWGARQLPTSNSQLPTWLSSLGVGSWELGVDLDFASHVEDAWPRDRARPYPGPPPACPDDRGRGRPRTVESRSAQRPGDPRRGRGVAPGPALARGGRPHRPDGGRCRQPAHRPGRRRAVNAPAGPAPARS